MHVVAGLRRGVAQHLHEAPAAVDLEFARAGDAAQLGLEELLDALLADLVALAVALALVDLELVLVDRGDVTDEVRGEIVVGVVTGRPPRGLHPGEELGVLLDVDERVEVHLLRDGHGLERGEARALEVRHDGLLRAQEHPGEVRGGDVRLREGEAAFDRHLVDQGVLDDDVALVVEDAAPDRRVLQDADAVLLGLRREAGRVRDLQEPQAGEQGREQGEDDHPDDPEPEAAVGLGHDASGGFRGSVMVSEGRAGARGSPHPDRPCPRFASATS